MISVSIFVAGCATATRSTVGAAGGSTERTSHIYDIGGKTYCLSLEKSVFEKTPIWLPEEKLEPPLSLERAVEIARSEIKKRNPGGAPRMRLWEVNLVPFSDLEKRCWYYIVSFCPENEVKGGGLGGAVATRGGASPSVSNLTPLVCVLMTGVALTGEEVEFPEWPQLPHYEDISSHTIVDNSGLRFVDSLSRRKRLAGDILWDAETGAAPPLSIGAAAGIARRELSKYVSDPEDFNLESVLLYTGIRRGATWIWFYEVALYPQTDEASFDDALSHIKPGGIAKRPSSGVKTGVLMSGASLGVLK